MELVARKADLVRELQFFQQIVERKNTIPILANVLLEGTGNEVTLLATDLEVALRSRCEAAVGKPGSVTLPAKKLYEVVRALPEGDVNIETDKGGNSVKVSGGQFSSKMPTLPREDFPSLPEAGGGVKATINGKSLAQMVAKTQFAITGEDTRFYLNGAQFVLKPDDMTFVATDGHRLALVNVKHDGAEGRRHQGDPAAQDAGGVRTAARRRQQRRQLRARREPPVLRDRPAAVDLANDRRPVSRLREGGAEGQRQARGVRARSADAGGAPRRRSSRTSDRAR